MEQKQQRVNELMKWAEIRGWETTAVDRETFASIIELATNDGYRKAAQVIQDETKEAGSHG